MCVCVHFDSLERLTARPLLDLLPLQPPGVLAVRVMPAQVVQWRGGRRGERRLHPAHLSPTAETRVEVYMYMAEG